MAVERYLLFTLVVFSVYTPAQTAVAQNAFSKDINACLFNTWTTASILTKSPDCSGGLFPLCYRASPTAPTKFAVCYDSAKETPVFTGHVVINDPGSGRDFKFKEDTGTYKPTPQALVDDYKVSKQLSDYLTFDQNKQEFCAKGHLVPNGDFGPDTDRALTFILTNIAPQWQLFNGGNWQLMEAGLHNYIIKKPAGTKVYVFTGVGGEAKNTTGSTYLMNSKVTAPRYYWKAMCDPSIKQSVVYVGENPVGSKSTTPVNGCNGSKQTTKLGVMQCMSLTSAKTTHPDFKLPDFVDANCKIGSRGTFLDTYITFK